MTPTPFPVRREAPRLRAVAAMKVLRPLPPLPQGRVLLIVSG
jgi:hypothetical protein